MSSLCVTFQGKNIHIFKKFCKKISGSPFLSSPFSLHAKRGYGESENVGWEIAEPKYCWNFPFKTYFWKRLFPSGLQSSFLRAVLWRGGHEKLCSLKWERGRAVTGLPNPEKLLGCCAWGEPQSLTPAPPRLYWEASLQAFLSFPIKTPIPSAPGAMVVAQGMDEELSLVRFWSSEASGLRWSQEMFACDVSAVGPWFHVIPQCKSKREREMWLGEPIGDEGSRRAGCRMDFWSCWLQTAPSVLVFSASLTISASTTGKRFVHYSCTLRKVHLKTQVCDMNAPS